RLVGGAERIRRTSAWQRHLQRLSIAGDDPDVKTFDGNRVTGSHLDVLSGGDCLGVTSIGALDVSLELRRLRLTRIHDPRAVVDERTYGDPCGYVLDTAVMIAIVMRRDHDVDRGQAGLFRNGRDPVGIPVRSEEHTSALQS